MSVSLTGRIDGYGNEDSLLGFTYHSPFGEDGIDLKRLEHRKETVIWWPFPHHPRVFGRKVLSAYSDIDKGDISGEDGAAFFSSYRRVWQKSHFTCNIPVKRYDDEAYSLHWIQRFPNR